MPVFLAPFLLPLWALLKAAWGSTIGRYAIIICAALFALWAYGAYQKSAGRAEVRAEWRAQAKRSQQIARKIDADAAADTGADLQAQLDAERKARKEIENAYAGMPGCDLDFVLERLRP